MIGDLCAMLFFVGLEGREKKPWLGATMAVHLGGMAVGIACAALVVLGCPPPVLLGGALAAGVAGAGATALLGGRRNAVAAAAVAAVLVECTSYLCVLFVLWFHAVIPG